MEKKVHKAIMSLLIMGMAGCSVYHPESVSVEEAINSHNRIKVETADNAIFELKEFRRENGQLYGITGRRSDAAKMMINRQQVRDRNNMKIAFTDEEIKAIHLKNKRMSNMVNLGVPLVGAAGLLGLTNSHFRPDVGN